MRRYPILILLVVVSIISGFFYVHSRSYKPPSEPPSTKNLLIDEITQVENLVADFSQAFQDNTHYSNGRTCPDTD